MLTLTDVYCLYNRARITNLISPEDLHRACLLFDQLKLGVTLREFENNVIVIQMRDHKEGTNATKISQIIKEKGPLTPFDISKILKIPISLSLAELLSAEKMELLCRDDSIQGLVFYPNFFKELLPN